jgi:hypothetical protein
MKTEEPMQKFNMTEFSKRCGNCQRMPAGRARLFEAGALMTEYLDAEGRGLLRFDRDIRDTFLGFLGTIQREEGA